MTKKEGNDAINLLLLSDEKSSHYFLIKNLSRLISSQVNKRKNKTYFCQRCINSFGKEELLQKHLEYCKEKVSSC